MAKAIPLDWPSLIGKCRSIFLGYSHWSLTGRFGKIEHPACDKYHIWALWPLLEFLGGNLSEFAKIDSRGSRLEARARIALVGRLFCEPPRKRISRERNSS